jgi:hypothetical protein
MSKYILKEGYETIITKSDDGHELLITPNTFNDYFGDLMMKNNQAHLLTINQEWAKENNTEKKTFTQITENVILLTSNLEKTENNLQNPTVNEPVLKRKRGRQPKNKV